MEQVKLFLDTNIVIDFFTGRMNDGIATKIVHLGEFPQFKLCISPLTGINTLYVLRKFTSKITLESLEELFTILPMNAEQWRFAEGLNIDEDPEDALQTACAMYNKCSAMITRDKRLKNAISSFYKAYLPEELLMEVS